MTFLFKPADCLKKQIIILLLIFYSILPLLVSLKQGIIIKIKRKRKKPLIPLKFLTKLSLVSRGK